MPTKGRLVGQLNGLDLERLLCRFDAQRAAEMLTNRHNKIKFGLKERKGKSEAQERHNKAKPTSNPLYFNLPLKLYKGL